MIKALIISNGIEGVGENMFQYSGKLDCTVANVTENFDVDLEPYDLLIVPNGADHVAMLKIKDKVAEFLDRGKALFCFDGWFTNWIPGNKWVHDNSKKTIDIRYKIKTDRYGLFRGIDVADLNFSHGISGWWAVGYIEPTEGADVVIIDTWERPLLVVDEISSKGLMVLSASAPIADYTYGTTDDMDSAESIAQLYRNCVDHLINERNEVFV